MNFHALKRWLCLAMWSCAAMPAHAQEPPAGSPYPVGHARDCVLVAGGGGSVFSDPKIDRIWLEINRQVTDSLFTDLRQNGYAVDKVFKEQADRADDQKKVLMAVSRSQCALLLQVSHEVGENAQGPYFGFDVTIMHFEANGEHVAETGTPVRTVGDFQKSYRYPRNAEELDKFHTGTFANTVYDDLLRSRAIDRVYAPDPDSAVVHEAYDRVAAANPAKEMHVRHILVDDEAKARTAIARIRHGESFAAVAREMSTDTGSARDGGDLGWAKPTSYVPEFARVVEAFEPKGFDPDPVRSPFGWHVIEVLETRPAVFPAFDDVKVRIAQALKQRHDEALKAKP